MLLCVVAVAGTGIIFEQREEVAALERERARVMSLVGVLAVELDSELRGVRRDALLYAETADHPATRRQFAERYARIDVIAQSEPGNDSAALTGDNLVRLSTATPESQTVRVDVKLPELLHAATFVDSPDEITLVSPPGARQFRTLVGTPVEVPALIAAARDNSTFARLSVADALALGLPSAPAFAAFSTVHTTTYGDWRISVVASARYEVERDQRGVARVVAKVALTALTALLFGWLAFNEYRRLLRAQADLERSKERAHKEALLAREARSAATLTFAAGVVHEVGTPLSLISLRAEALAEGTDEDPQAAGAAIVKQVHRVRQVLQGVLGVARGTVPARSRYAPAQLIETACQLVAHRVEAAQVRVVRTMQPALPDMLGDALLLEQALVNLLLNAIDASPAGGTVTVSATIEDGGGASLLLAVTDEGHGIPPAAAHQVLEPFYTTKPEGHGMGLGLAIVSEIARMHGGHLELVPHAPRGTRAVLHLPFHTQETPRHDGD